MCDFVALLTEAQLSTFVLRLSAVFRIGFTKQRRRLRGFDTGASRLHSARTEPGCFRAEVLTASRSLNPLSAGLAMALLLCLVLVVPVSVAADVIVNRDVPVSKLSRETLRSSFIMRKLAWSDGRPIRVFVLPDGHPLHKEFAKQVLDVYPYQLRQAWDRLVFSGTGQAPVEVASEQEMLAQVAATPGAVGYVKRKQPNDPVNVLAVE
jgi:hypothetical protein